MTAKSLELFVHYHSVESGFLLLLLPLIAGILVVNGKPRLGMLLFAIEIAAFVGDAFLSKMADPNRSLTQDLHVSIFLLVGLILIGLLCGVLWRGGREFIRSSADLEAKMFPEGKWR